MELQREKNAMTQRIRKISILYPKSTGARKPVTLLKRDSNTGVFLTIFRKDF